jgi:hypothetical protein
MQKAAAPLPVKITMVTVRPTTRPVLDPLSLFSLSASEKDCSLEERKVPSSVLSVVCCGSVVSKSVVSAEVSEVSTEEVVEGSGCPEMQVELPLRKEANMRTKREEKKDRNQ